MRNISKPSLTLNSFVKNERIKQVVMAVVAAMAIGSAYLYWSSMDRKSPNFSGVEADIAMANQEVELLRQLDSLPDVYDQWEKAVIFSAGYGITLKPLEQGSPHSLNVDLSGGGHIWQGVLEGEPYLVLMTATNLQKQMPSAMGDLTINNGRAALVFGVIGAPPVKMNTGTN